MSYSHQYIAGGHSCGCAGGTYMGVADSELERLKREYELKIKALENMQAAAESELKNAQQAVLDSANTIASQQHTIERQQDTIKAQQEDNTTLNETIQSQQDTIDTQQEITSSTAKLLLSQQQTIEKLLKGVSVDTSTLYTKDQAAQDKAEILAAINGSCGCDDIEYVTEEDIDALF